MAAKALKSKLNLKGEYQAQVHSGQMVLMVVRQGDVINDTDDDDEVRPIASQNCVTVTLSTSSGYSIYSSPLI